MQPFATEFCVTARCNTPFERTLRTPRVGVSRGPGEIKVPKTEPRFPHEIGYRATRPSTTGYSFGTGFGRPVGVLNVTSSIDKFNSNTSTRCSIGSTTSSIGSSPIGNGSTASPTFSNYPNPVGRSIEHVDDHGGQPFILPAASRSPYLWCRTALKRTRTHMKGKRSSATGAVTPGSDLI